MNHHSSPCAGVPDVRQKMPVREVQQEALRAELKRLSVFCQIPCLSGGRCIGRDLCWCPSNSTGKFCHLPAPPPARHTPHNKDASHQEPKSPLHSMYTLPLSNQQVQIHQVALVQPGQRPPAADGAHSVQQRSQPGNGHEPADDHGGSRPPHAAAGDEHHQARTHERHNGHVGRCFQETDDGQCGRPLPGLTKQDDCCGSVGASWGLNKCQKCPTKPVVDFYSVYYKSKPK
ncbi:Latent-transforming growth factor beta-binding protein 2 [Liparis tanakae]|uniref:Latent-transforming growth factor beta-binding protein 2 n=1 Tax=Liparis tanakae TaxID=230148 RepID=A0A4Z2G342_9TELE|nr:Latent-transforming growth factor beta-binding protein 2 [Liparis tanakae]